MASSSSDHETHFSNLVDLLRARRAEHGSRAAFRFLSEGETEEARITYEELESQARAIAASLASHGAAGERALLVYPAGLEFIAAFWGCIYAGAVAVPVFPARLHRQLPRLLAIAADCGAKFVLTTTKIRGQSEDLFKRAPELKKFQWLATDDVPSTLAAEWRDPGANLDTLAFLQYTSGSTSAPRGVMVTHGNLLHNLSCLREVFGFSRKSVGVTWLPHYHDMGLIGGLLQPLYAGGEMIVMPPSSFLQRPHAVAGGAVALPGDHYGRAEFCVRTLRPKNLRRKSRGARSLHDSGGALRRRTGAPRYADSICRSVRAVRLPGGGFPARLRPGRIHADRFRTFRGRRAGYAVRAGGSPAAPPCGSGVKWRGGRTYAYWLRRRRTGAEGRDRRCRNAAALCGGWCRRNLDFGSERRQGLLEQARGNRADFRRASGVWRGAVPAHRRSRFSGQRTGVRYRTIERSDHYSRLEPLSTGFGTHGGTQPPRASPRVRGRVLDRIRRRGAAGDRAGSERSRCGSGRGCSGRDSPRAHRIARRAPRRGRSDRAAQHSTDLQRKDSALCLPRRVSRRRARSGARVARSGSARRCRPGRREPSAQRTGVGLPEHAILFASPGWKSE